MSECNLSGIHSADSSLAKAVKSALSNLIDHGCREDEHMGRWDVLLFDRPMSGAGREGINASCGAVGALEMYRLYIATGVYWEAPIFFD